MNYVSHAPSFLFMQFIKMQSIFDITNKEEDLYAILNCVNTSSVREEQRDKCYS